MWIQSLATFTMLPKFIRLQKKEKRITPYPDSSTIHNSHYYSSQSFSRHKKGSGSLSVMQPTFGTIFCYAPHFQYDMIRSLFHVWQLVYCYYNDKLGVPFDSTLLLLIFQLVLKLLFINKINSPNFGIAVFLTVIIVNDFRGYENSIFLQK